MYRLLPKQRQSLLALTGLLSILAISCPSPTSAPPPPPTPTPTPTNFTFAVSVRDRNRGNRPVGQAIVLLEVGNETVDQQVTEDTGQANFTVSSAYLGKSGRLFAKAHNYHSADITFALRNDTRQIIQLIPSDFPKLDPDPPEPSPPSGSKPRRSPTPVMTRPELGLFAPGEVKTGALADEQVVDYRFEADKNVPLIFTGRVEEDRLDFNMEIYDSKGFPLKDMFVRRSSEGKKLPFTPPQTGSYVFRIRGRANFGRYVVSLEELQ